jgi:NAD(P)-dependent dehydrogenase (short-subunit alcohol dehydrogenase family)
VATRAALVTGASSGIGRATALELARSGFTVFAGVRKPEDGEAVQSEAHGELEPVLIDVTDTEQIEAAVERISERTRGRGLTALVNNAGSAHSGAIEFLDLDDLRQQLEVNLIGQIAVTQKMLPMLRSNRGRIANVTSIGGIVATPYMAPYCASKFALEAVTDCLRSELKPWGIEVIAIEPGSIATDIWDRGIDTANAARAKLPAEGERLYGQAFEAMTRVSAETGERGIPPEEAARVIHKALTVKRPRARYLVGRDAVGMKAASALLPDKAWDALVRRQLKLPG